MNRSSTSARPASPTAALDRVLTGPKSARTAAAAALEEFPDGSAERVDALWSLGKSALEDNRIADAIALLELAAAESDGDAVGRARIECTLALALGADGRPEDAASVLAAAEAHLDGADLARLRNQRGMLMVDAGQLADARTELMAAAEGLRAAGDTAAEARTVGNLGVVTSLMGSLSEAQRWFERARDLAEATGQDLVVAGTESNLGYVAGRRGDFPAAIRWFEAARAAFSDMGGADRSIATLETDYARTLIDAGLASDAAEAARRALRFARSGRNQTLEAQSHLLLAEALLDLGSREEAQRHLQEGRSRFERAGAAPMVRHADLLAAASLGDDVDTDALRRVVRTARELDAAGWKAEAVETAIVAARIGIRAGIPRQTRRSLQRFATPVRRERGARRAALHHLHALLRIVDGDASGARAAVRAGLRALEQQRALVVSVELQAGLARRGEALSRLGMELTLEAGNPADVLRWADSVRGQALRRPVAVLAPDGHDSTLEERVRTATTAVTAARLGGGDLAAAEANLRRCESELTTSRRATSDVSASVGSLALLVPRELRAAIGAATLVQFVTTRERVAAVVATSSRMRLVDLGLTDDLAELAARQSEALRRMNRSERIARAAGEDLADATLVIQQRLLDPLRLRIDGPVVLIPTGQLHAMQWSACPLLRDRPFVVAPSARSWMQHDATSPGSGVAVLGGPGLDHTTSELDRVSRLHGDATVVSDSAADVAMALRAFREQALVHVAAHGTFRTDNPLFSSLHFTDGPLNLFDLEVLDAVARVVVLGACESAAVSATGGELIGTTAMLLRLGVRNVVASGVEVGDAAIAELLTEVHRGLAANSTPADALAAARSRAFADGGPSLVAAASTTAVFGTSLDPGPVSARPHTR